MKNLCGHLLSTGKSVGSDHIQSNMIEIEIEIEIEIGIPVIELQAPKIQIYIKHRRVNSLSLSRYCLLPRVSSLYISSYSCPWPW
uniref:Unclassified n=1 Tax=Fusarium clavum TaxID=2594811 RepID=W1ID20_9HYPO|nr:unclassified [Fusarium clavum]CEF82640.1 unclassified [Fusarium clavum]